MYFFVTYTVKVCRNFLNTLDTEENKFKHWVRNPNRENENLSTKRKREAILNPKNVEK